MSEETTARDERVSVETGTPDAHGDDSSAPAGSPDSQENPGATGDGGGSAGSGPDASGDAGGGVDPAGDEEGEAIADELARLKEEFDALNDQHLRLAAEFNNYRRRREAERLETWGRAQAELVGYFLDVLDDLQRVSGLDPADEAVTVESIVEGIDLVERKFVRTLVEAGAEIVEPEEGDAFDPEKMEAMMRVPDESGDRDDLVAQLFQRGYLFKGTLVRPARVSVYKA